MMKSGNVVRTKAFKFAKDIIFLSQHLEEKRLFSIKDQLFRSGTSIGANIEEALGARSKKEFLSKISISYFEARETTYWLRLIKETQNIDVEEVLKDYEVLLKIIGKIQTTLKKNS